MARLFNKKLHGREIHAGSSDKILKWNNCPDCKGIGYFNITPFREINKEFRQCLTCENAHADQANLTTA